MKIVRKQIGKTIKKAIYILIKPFIPILLIIVIILLLCSYISEILSLGFEKEEKSNIKQELKYYHQEEYTEEDKNGFLSGIMDFVNGIFQELEFAIDTEWPVMNQYKITSPFGDRDAPTAGASTSHSGIDIGAPEGSKLVAIMDGTVTSVGWGGAGGFTITIKADNYTFSYCHSHPNFIVKVGQEVKKGQIIGAVGPKNVYGVTRKSI